jgi:tetratricopeptide (TPR) repeat protein
VAYNFAEGNAPERAAPYAYRAGQHAASLAAWAEAAALFELAWQAETDPASRLRSLMALGNARSRAGLNAQSSEAFKLALEQAQGLGDATAAAEAQLALAQSYLTQARFAEAIRLAQQLLGQVEAPLSIAAVEMVWATALSLEGADLAGAAEHLEKVERLLQTAVAAGHADPVRLAHVKFEQGSVAAQQGDLPRAVALYRQALDLAGQSLDPEAPMRQILANNNLAYHLELLSPGDPAARAYAEAGLKLAQAHGVLGLLPYLHSTLGEIELDAGRLDEAEARFAEGLALAERLPMPERVAGLTANLGRVAEARGDHSLAIYRFSTALAQADALGTLHLAAQIRLWLAPLLPPAEGRARLAEARSLAENGGRRRLLDEARRLEQQPAEPANRKARQDR